MSNLSDKPLPHGGDVYHLARSLGLNLSDLLDFSANINPLGFPPGLYGAVKKAMGEIVHYPDRRCLVLRQDLAVYHHLTPEEILVGNGSTELIYLAARVLKPERGLIVTPAFSEYEHALAAAGVPVAFQATAEAHNFTLKEVFEAHAGDLVFLAHPASPSGALLAPELFLEVAAALDAAGAFLLLDEAFIDFVEEASYKSLLGRFPRLMILRSFTKFFGIPGMRLGCLLAGPELVGRLAEAQEPWSVNTMAQVMGRACLADRDYMARTRALIAQERQFLWERLADLPGLTPFPSTVNYLLVKLDRVGLTAARLQQNMLGHRIAIRDASNFRGLDERFFRIAVRTREENERLLKALAECLEHF
ncbi:MAG: threonine-phosphate decarboxylase CobD [Thermodesulfobacteriota bacterium]